MVSIEKSKRPNLTLVEKDFKPKSKEETEYSLKLIDNIKLIRNIVRDLRPESVVVEMCDDRYNRWLADVIAHPNYDSTISQIHRIMDKKPEKLLEFD